ncbi:uncharacterized protein LOC113524617 [Pangasianodon hypophthalmus]|uniref:uncharacterized protein LOC113524617 n=1 Tax=Pangasianodon hypophthalmus TaxID=310915 RepID=UPI002307F586|nr:uncharacterized protein LOC113524617 [Pangasianodon hypophthalmus]
MSSIRVSHTVRCERAPLRDVQNERSVLQQTPSSVKVCEVHSDQKENLSENTSVTNVTFKSFTCAGGEVEISDRSDLSDESVLITRDSSDPHTVNNSTLTHEETEGEHEDHPYCRYAADRTQDDHASSGNQSLSHTDSPDVTFKSFTCPGGEVEIADDESIERNESVLSKDPDLETQGFEDEVSDEHTELPSRHFDHPYCNTQTSELRSGKMEEEEEDDASISISKNAPDVTFKSFTCPGGEVEIAEESLVPEEESLVKNDSLIVNVSELQSEICDELPSRHFDHLYCNIQTSELGSGKVEEEEEHDDDGGDGGSVIPPSISISKNATDVTFKSFTCPGGEVELAEESLVKNESLMKSDSLIANDSELQNLESEICDELPSRHFDHLYCNTQTSELGSGKMEEEEEHDGEGDDDGDGGSVIPPSISKNATDVTFKSFTCPGGEVEIAEESLMKNESFESFVLDESLMKNESLSAKDSEVQNLQSETCEEHTELPSRHFDHLYCNDETESFPVQVNDSVTRASMFDSNDPEGVITTNDSSRALNGSAAAERRDDVTFRFSGAEVEIENTYRKFDVSTLMKGLNISDQTQSSSNTEASEHGGESFIVREQDDQVYCHGVKNDLQLTVSENETHLSVQISNSGVSQSSESAVRSEGSENMKSEIIVPESSSDTTEEQNVKSVQQRDLDQQTSANLEENVLKDENPRLRCNFEEMFSDENDKISHSQPGADRIPENFGTAETQKVPNADDADVSTHAEPEILRSESVDLEAQVKMWSHIILSEPSTPKHSARRTSLASRKSHSSSRSCTPPYSPRR